MRFGCIFSVRTASSLYGEEWNTRWLQIIRRHYHNLNKSYSSRLVLSNHVFPHRALSVLGLWVRWAIWDLRLGKPSAFGGWFRQRILISARKTFASVVISAYITHTHSLRVSLSLSLAESTMTLPFTLHRKDRTWDRTFARSGSTVSGFMSSLLSSGRSEYVLWCWLGISYFPLTTSLRSHSIILRHLLLC